MRVFWIRVAFELVDSIDCPSQCGWASSNSLKAWMEEKVQEGGITFFLPDCFTWGILAFPALCAPGSQFFRFKLESTSLTSLGLRLNYTIGFPGSPAWRWQIVGLLSLHKHVTQFILINLSSIYLLVSLENSNTDLYSIGSIHVKF